VLLQFNERKIYYSMLKKFLMHGIERGDNCERERESLEEEEKVK
jgi:hypothetical protein